MIHEITPDQAALTAVIVLTLVSFIIGKWRHDMVAMGALLACVAIGLVPASEAFSGFAHPAVITVACVLILSRALQSSGAIDALMQAFLPQVSGGGARTTVAMAGLAAVLSAFMNNVGALALMMPVAIQRAGRLGIPASKILMPLAFASILGGMTTLIGTPPNLIVSNFRETLSGHGFAMFDFTPVGLAVAGVGVLFVAICSRWLVPARQRASTDVFETSAYVTEGRVTQKSKAAGLMMREIDALLEKTGAQVIGLVRNESRVLAPGRLRKIEEGDILVIEAEPDGLAAALSSLGLKLEEDVGKAVKGSPAAASSAAPSAEKKSGKAGKRQPASSETASGPEDALLTELAVLPFSQLAGQSATSIRLRTRYGINLLAVSRQGRRSMSRLRTMAIKPGDVLLMQGAHGALNEFASEFDCVPLADRPLRLPDSGKALTAGAIMAAAVASTALGLAPAAVSFSGGVLAMMACHVVPPRVIYNAIDWPVIVLLAALIPVAQAMETTGSADFIAGVLLNDIANDQAIIGLVLLLLATMMLSDFMNNAATAAVMCPIAIHLANQTGSSADPFLMAVAVGASCAFLTPIGHQNNTLILGPGGFRFGDYWPLGLPLEILVTVTAVPMLLVVWPL